MEDAEELAQQLADYFNPPHWEQRRRTDIPIHELKKLPWEERFERVWVQKTPESDTMIVKHREDGPYITSLSFLDIVVALNKINEEKTNEK